MYSHHLHRQHARNRALRNAHSRATVRAPHASSRGTVDGGAAATHAVPMANPAFRAATAPAAGAVPATHRDSAAATTANNRRRSHQETHTRTHSRSHKTKGGRQLSERVVFSIKRVSGIGVACSPSCCSHSPATHLNPASFLCPQAAVSLLIAQQAPNKGKNKKGREASRNASKAIQKLSAHHNCSQENIIPTVHCANAAHT